MEGAEGDKTFGSEGMKVFITGDVAIVRKGFVFCLEPYVGKFCKNVSY